MTDQLSARTIADFGEQWTSYPGTDGYFGSPDLFNDFLNPLMSDRDVGGSRVAEIGAGNGRFVNVVAAAGAAHIIALEPSQAMRVLRRNTEPFRDRITYLEATGDQLPPSGDLDYVYSIGVLHHIPEPDPVVSAAFRALRPGGTIAVWLYGREGNGLYLLLAHSLRVVTRKLPHRGLELVVAALYPALRLYMALCRVLPLPLAEYMRRVLLPLTPAARRIVVYDQLNPAYAKYYTKAEEEQLLTRAGFTRVRVHHRHGISWTVAGTRP
jgi:SAM-dependent methyltransferase